MTKWVLIFCILLIVFTCKEHINFYLLMNHDKVFVSKVSIISTHPPIIYNPAQMFFFSYHCTRYRIGGWQCGRSCGWRGWGGGGGRRGRGRGGRKRGERWWLPTLAPGGRPAPGGGERYTGFLRWIKLSFIILLVLAVYGILFAYIFCNHRSYWNPEPQVLVTNSRSFCGPVR